jgi:hypothetical protein
MCCVFQEYVPLLAKKHRRDKMAHCKGASGEEVPWSSLVFHSVQSVNAVLQPENGWIAQFGCSLARFEDLVEVRKPEP